jgi:hypothetical protein
MIKHHTALSQAPTNAQPTREKTLRPSTTSTKEKIKTSTANPTKDHLIFHQEKDHHPYPKHRV